MATSGVSTWSLTRDSIINSALRKIGVLAEGASANAAQLLTGAEALNGLLKTLITKGMPVWAMKEYSFPTVADTDSYNIGNSQTLATPMPLKIVQAYRVESTDAVNVPLEVKNHYDFNLLPVNASSGEPVAIYYQPFATYGTIKLWPAPVDATTTITIVYQRPFEDMVAGADDLDFPSYWTEAIIYNLAWRLAPEYGSSKDERGAIKAEAKELIEEALSFGSEEGSIYIMPDWSGKN